MSSSSTTSRELRLVVDEMTMVNSGLKGLKQNLKVMGIAYAVRHPYECPTIAINPQPPKLDYSHF